MRTTCLCHSCDVLEVFLWHFCNFSLSSPKDYLHEDIVDNTNGEGNVFHELTIIATGVCFFP